LELNYCIWWRHVIIIDQGGSLSIYVRWKLRTVFQCMIKWSQQCLGHKKTVDVEWFCYSVTFQITGPNTEVCK